MIKVLFLSFILFSGAASAALNPEQIASDPSENGWNGSIGVSVSGKEGNTREKDIEATTYLNHKMDRIITTYVVGGIYSEEYSDNEKVEDEEYLGYIRNRYGISTSSWSIESFYKYIHDSEDAINNQHSVGFGAQNSLCSCDNFSLDTGFNVVYIYTKYYADEPIERTTDGLTYVTYKYSNGDIEFLEKVEYQRNLEEKEDYTILNRLGISTSLVKSIGISLLIDYQYQNAPVGVSKKEDVDYSLNFTYSF